MAVTIKLKNASGSDPSASDLVVGEVALRTDTAKLFTKKDDNSVAEIGVTVGTDSVNTSAIQDDAVTADKLASNAVVNASVSSSAAIAGTKISPDFGSQAITTTGNCSFGDLTLENAQPSLILSDNNAESDFALQNRGGVFTVRDIDNNANRFQVATDGTTTVAGNLDCSSGVDVTGNITVSGTVDGRDVAADGTKLDGIESGATADQTKSDIDALGIAASTATTLATARTIAGVSFDGSANISLNNNAITNGAGYITATLTNEQVQDIVGGMLTGNTETGITVTYQDGDGTIDFVVGTLNQDTTGNAATATALETARNIGGVSFDGTGNINLPGVNTSGNQNTSGNAATATKLATARTIAGVSFDGSANISLNNNAITNGAGYLTSVATSNIADDAVTFAKLENIAENHIVGRVSSGTGIAQELNATEVRSLLNVANGATNVTNNNQLTNGAGYITSADGGNAATLDSIDSSQFARSDTADTLSGLMTFSGGASFGADARCAAALSTLSDGANIQVNFISGIHHTVTLGGNRTFSDPSNTASAIGQSGSIFIVQDGTGGRTLAFHGDYKFAGGTAPTLSTAANAVDRLDYVIRASDNVHCVVSLDVK